MSAGRGLRWLDQGVRRVRAPGGQGWSSVHRTLWPSHPAVGETLSLRHRQSHKGRELQGATGEPTDQRKLGQSIGRIPAAWGCGMLEWPNLGVKAKPTKGQV